MLFLSFFFNNLNKIIKKKKNRVVFIGYPDFDDMLRGILPYLNDKELIVLTNKKNIQTPLWLSSNVTLVYKKSILGFISILTAEVIYYTHGIFSFFNLLDERKQKVINLWHGMPLKLVGALDGSKKLPKFHKTICTSKLYKKIISEVFDVDLEKVVLSGLPRNDFLLNKNRSLKLFSDYNQVITWLPTYRASKEGEVRTDSNNLNLLGSDQYNLKDINNYLYENNYILILKPHPVAKFILEEDDYSNILVINEWWLNENNLTLYELLSLSDMLISDYSSVIIDFMVTNRKIVIANGDSADYLAQRGFIIDPNELPFMKARNTEELILSLESEDFDYIKYKHKYISEDRFNHDKII